METIGSATVIPADPDSHFRLRNCPNCGGDNVAYVEYLRAVKALRWVQCFTCGHQVDAGAESRHGAQVAWNREARA